MTPLHQTHSWVAVHLRSGGEENTRAHAFCETKHVDGTQGVGLDGLDWVVHVVWRAGWGRKVVNLVNLDHKRLNDIVVDELKVWMANPVESE